MRVLMNQQKLPFGQFHQANQNPGASKVTANCEMFVNPEQSALVFLGNGPFF